MGGSIMVTQDRWPLCRGGLDSRIPFVTVLLYNNYVHNA